MGAIDKAVSFFTGLTARDVDSALAGIADDCVYFGLEYKDGRMGRRYYNGKRRLADYVGTFLATSAGGHLKYDIRAVAGDEKRVFVEWADEASSVDGKQYQNRGVHVFEFNDQGMALNIRCYCDWAPLETWAFTPPG
jgi:ketosteroid isomerase-like protein